MPSMTLDPTRPWPYYGDFVVGAELPQLPAITVTAADNVLYRSITGDQHLLSSSRYAYSAVGGAGVLINPAVVIQYSIGQSTMATRQAIANLYYREMRVLSPVIEGETLSTVTTVLGLSDSSPKNGVHRGKVWLGITTRADGRDIMTYERCALVRSGSTTDPGHHDAIPGPPDPVDLAGLAAQVPAWNLDTLPATAWSCGEERIDPLHDHIDLAAPFARMIFNQAAVHRDEPLAGGRRLVFGGHVQGLANASLTRLLPGVAATVAWDSCDHLAPAYEGDLLEFRHHLVDELPIGNGRLLRFVTTGTLRWRDGAPQSAELLRWVPIVWAP